MRARDQGNRDPFDLQEHVRRRCGPGLIELDTTVDVDDIDADALQKHAGLMPNTRLAACPRLHH
jgi:hypothetical protein